MSQETIVVIVVAIIGSGGSGVFVTWILSKVDQRHDPLHEGVRNCCSATEALHRQMVDGRVLRAFRGSKARNEYMPLTTVWGGNGTEPR